MSKAFHKSKLLKFQNWPWVAESEDQSDDWRLHWRQQRREGVYEDLEPSRSEIHVSYLKSFIPLSISQTRISSNVYNMFVRDCLMPQSLKQFIGRGVMSSFKKILMHTLYILSLGHYIYIYIYIYISFFLPCLYSILL